MFRTFDGWREVLVDETDLPRARELMSAEGINVSCSECGRPIGEDGRWYSTASVSFTRTAPDVHRRSLGRSRLSYERLVLLTRGGSLTMSFAGSLAGSLSEGLHAEEKGSSGADDLKERVAEVEDRGRFPALCLSAAGCALKAFQADTATRRIQSVIRLRFKPGEALRYA